MYRLTRRLFSHVENGKRVKVLYDGACPLCMKEINILKKVDKSKQTLTLIDLTQPGYKPEENQNIQLDDALAVMHVIGKDGKVFTKFEAIRHMYEAVGLGFLWKWTKLPIIEPRVDAIYLWFARNRRWLTGKNPDQCDSHCETKFKGKQ